MYIKFDEDDFNAFERAYYMVSNLKDMLYNSKIVNAFGLTRSELFTLEEDMRTLLRYIESHTDWEEI